MRRLIAAAVACTGMWMGLGTGVAHADSGQPWMCVGVDSMNVNACLADPMPDRLPFF
jgi:hypothetical protein